MIRENNIRALFPFAIIRLVFAGIFFISLFTYFFLLNRYHLAFQEQLQLFRFSTDYFLEFLSYPGGLLDYTGAFFTQFFLFPFPAAMIITIALAGVFILTGKILRSTGLKDDVLAYFPVLMLVALQSNHLWSFSNSLGLILVLVYFSLCQAVRFKVAILLLSWPLLYMVAGGFAFVAGLSVIIRVLNHRRNNLIHAGLFSLLFTLIPLLSGQTIYLIEDERLWTGSLPRHLGTPFTEIQVILLVYFPVVLLLSKLQLRKNKIGESVKGLSISATVNVLLILFSAGIIIKFFYDRETELLLGLDHHVQKSGWKEVLEESGRIKDANRMALHYTNLALYKTGDLGDKLLHYPQSGKSGLWLDWQQDWLAAFFGCRTCFDLGYNSEAYRWAHESMIARGPNPRSLKILVLASIVDDNLNLGSKYLRVLSQTLFYRQWGKKYTAMCKNPELIHGDTEIMEKKSLVIKSDFINSANPGGRLNHLLREHPGNRMAFEYQMASFLLEKDLDGFVAGMEVFRNFGYTSLPVHYQEALAAYKSYSGKDAVPEGYVLSKQVTDRLGKYAKTVYSYGTSNASAAEKMYPEFGNTYWYYLKFVDSEKPLF